MIKTGHKKILATNHSGKLRHHRHTSYASLVGILLLTFIPLLMASNAIVSAAATDPVQGTYGTFADVPGPLPLAPTISNLTNGRVFIDSQPLLIRGTCSGSSLVKVFKNEILAGATLCQNGAYQMNIDLFIGNNSLIARAYNTNDAVSPDSQPVSVQLNLPGSKLTGTEQLNTIGAPAGQFYATGQIFYKGANAGDTMTWPITLAGGQPPYAVNISWGDGKTQLLSRGDSSTFDIQHVYDKAAGQGGNYKIVITSTDQAGATSYLQFVAVVAGGPGAANGAAAGRSNGGSTGGSATGATVLSIGWKVLAASILVVAGFWLGELREAKLLKRLAGHPA
jgi:hypothetical protein